MALEEKINPPITLTEEAAKQILASPNEDGLPLRLGVRGGGCSGFEYAMDFDAPRETDLEYEVFGVKLIVDPISVRYLEGTVIDYVETMMQQGYKFDNPNAKGTCGCGSSFSY